MSKLRLGYVGAGFMAQKVHIPNFLSIPECEVIALAEMRPRLGEKVARRFGIGKFYTSHVDLINDPQVEAVAVSASPAEQAEIAKEALRAGKCVFMEKPMGVSVEQAERLLEAGRDAGARVMVAYMKRYDAGNEMVKVTLDEWHRTGQAGRPLYARARDFGGDWIANLDTPLDNSDESYFPSPAPVPSWLPERLHRPYGEYVQGCCHLINLLRWFLNANSNVRVKAVDLDEDGLTGVAVMEMNGVRTVLESAEMNSHRWEEETQIFFSKGYVKTWPTSLLLRNMPAEVEVYLGGENPETRRPVAQPKWTWAYRRQCEFFVSATLSGQQYRTDGEDALNDMRVLEDIYRKCVFSARH